jgi:rifampicin phosphotransferase
MGRRRSGRQPAVPPRQLADYAVRPPTPGPRLIIPFTTTAAVAGADVGGKAASLLRMSRAGLPVPSGAVVASAFFARWLAALDAETGSTDPEARMRRAQALPLDAAQHAALRELHGLIGNDVGIRFAVRSSAADEDSADASFAGIYQTLLGVDADGIEAALRQCFAATFAPHALAYRQQRGLTPRTARFAVVVQRQIDSEISGVGFSVNPLNNDHDEAVFAASWGLGTAVVDGRVSPDQFVVDKTDGRLIEETRGDKLLAIRLAAAGGVVEGHELRTSDRTLTDPQLRELTRVIGEIETLYATPVDIEWAYADDRLHLLQARPVTTVVPLPEVMRTRPGERRRLYMDAALSKGMTSNRPFSPLGLDQTERAFLGMVERWLGPVGRIDTPDAPIFFAGARMYVNLSDMLRWMSPKRLAQGHAPTDLLTAAILAGIDRDRYRAPQRPRWLKASLLWRLPRLLWRIRGLFWYALKAVVAPEAVFRDHRQAVARIRLALQACLDDDRPLEALQREMSQQMVAGFDVLMAALLVGTLSPRLALGRQRAGNEALLEALSRGVSGNVVVDMSLALHRLAGMLPQAAFDDLDGLAERVAQGRLPAAFLQAWDGFIAEFGWRGADEMDVASPRYADAPLLALRQISFMAAADGFDLTAAHARHAEQRRHAYASLEAQLSWWRRILLRRIRRLNELFAGSRDTPKHVNVLCNYVIRRRALREGGRLVAAGRLDAPADVFDLTFDDLRRAGDEPALDLRALGAARSAFGLRLQAQVRSFPPLIDSRGRILRAAPGPARPGVLSGMPISPGVVSGPVKVLRRADHKPVLGGDVLVAYTTDPGWTPLFVNSAAVVLEVGGMLQHGAVVAREFGKPCVAGIAGVVDSLVDGEWVEVDGAAGTVTRLPAPVKSGPGESAPVA